MDGSTLTQVPCGPIDEVVKFLRDLQTFRGFRLRAAKHALRFARLYRTKLSHFQMCLALGSGVLLCANDFATSFSGSDYRKLSPPRTFISSTEPLDRLYKPAFRVDSRFEHYFQPTMVTDAKGRLHEDVADGSTARKAAVFASTSSEQGPESGWAPGPMIDAGQ